MQQIIFDEKISAKYYVIDVKCMPKRVKILLKIVNISKKKKFVLRGCGAPCSAFSSVSWTAAICLKLKLPAVLMTQFLNEIENFDENREF